MITKSWEREISIKLAGETTPAERRIELRWLAGASVLVACGLVLVGAAKVRDFGEASARLAAGDLLNLNSLTDAEHIQPFLLAITDRDSRALAAQAILDYVESHPDVANDGALARIRFDGDRLPLPKIKPLLVVRTPREFLVQYTLWCLIYVTSFWMVHLLWRWRQFRGDPELLPVLHLLTGIGLMLAVSLRDPLRDTLEFRKFAWGVALGCALLLLPLLRFFHHQNFAKLTYTPLFAALGLFLLLLVRGTGPTGSDAKVNLGPFQPVELIKVLLVLFLAGYFSRKWEWLRELNQRKIPWVPVPRLAHAVPVMTGVAGALVMFFVLKDMGPALVTGFLLLVMFAAARNRSGLALAGVIVLVAGVTAGYRYGKPKTVVERVSMWLSPWDNDVRGGDQLAHSLWAFSTGGLTGSGPGWGDPEVIPAGHTDLVLPAIAEEWGFVGVVTIGLLFVLLLRRVFLIALRAPDEFAMFVALGLGALLALEMLLISGGVLGAIPLSGVVSPFLSAGNTAMLANFLIIAFIAGISSRSSGKLLHPPFLRPVRGISITLAALTAALAARAGYIQVLHGPEFMIRDARVIEQDGVKRPQVNPRLHSLAAEIPRGTISDRGGIPLATSDWRELEAHRADYEKLGVSIDEACTRIESRHYPFGAATAHLLGDLRTGENFHASNASLIEHDSNARLQGYSDIHDLAPLVRARHQPFNPGMRALLSKDRSVRSTIDARLQQRVAQLMKKTLQPARKDGALVVLEPETGDVLALASYPSPGSAGLSTPEELLDRARYGQYPPGSTFKLVTAIAALRIDPKLADRKYECRRLPDGRAGAVVDGWRRPIRDDIGDHPHGALSMKQALTVSCNAYFAQLGTYDVGARSLHDTAALFEIPAGDVSEIAKMMPFSSYGQGPVLVTPFKMARVAATIAAGGKMPQGRWTMDESNSRAQPAQEMIPPEHAAFLTSAMRSVVTDGTARRAMKGLDIAVAGKTGTAQVGEGAPHSWFAGFAPVSGEHRIAFAVVVEHGGYGSQFAAPLARQVIEAARDLGIIQQ
ncbi:MAG: FtsW/RodA/SpoVE family cell cycle protein [Bryobacterales bacterium]|nr:FtsW/RodA/SpoVE family cell cycle protein [Bryobacterales bacterium]MBV9399059.1 FtsW/RodA/SpoVE family cell cycle protein [Bryobacterales bacterium]